jgi:hypothetical protein
MTTSDLRFGFNADNEITLGRIAIFGQICGLCRNLQSGKGMLQVPPPSLPLPTLLHVMCWMRCPWFIKRLVHYSVCSSSIAL